MARGAIKGITIEIGADSSPFKKAFSDINKTVKGTASSLRDINKLLKLDPGNTTLLKQKQEELKRSIEQTKQKIDLEKEALAKLKDADQTPEVVRQQEALQREIIEDEQRLKSLEGEFKNFGSVAKQAMIAVGDKVKEVGKNISDFGDKIAGVGKNMTAKVTAPIVGAFGAAVKVTSDFDSSMSQVAATMGKTMDELNSEITTVETSTGEFTGTLRDFAQEMGKTTAFSATEAADALNYMALAGYDAETSMKMLPTVLDLAAAGGIELANASDMVTDAQSALGLSIEETAIMVDQMAAASSKSNTSVAQLGDAILKIGATGRNVAGGTQELATVLGVLADNGIKGSEGGTHLRNMLLSLQKASKDGAVSFGDFSVQLYDADGNMRSMIDVIGEMQDGMGDMTQEAKDAMISGIFNKTDLAAVNALLGTSKDRFEELGGAIGDSTGAAAQMADTQLDNLQGQLTLLKSAMEGVAIQIGDILMPKIREIVGVIQEWVQKFADLDEGTKETIVKIALVAAAIGPVLVVVGTLISVIGKVVMGVGTLIKLLAMIATPVGLVVTAIGALVAAFLYFYNTNEEFRNKVNEIWEQIRSKIAEVIEVIKGIIQTFTELATEIWARWGDNIMAVVETIFGAIGGIISGALTVIQGIFNTILAVIRGDWQSAWSGLQTIASGALQIIRNIITIGFTMIQSVVRAALAVIQAVFSTAFQAIQAVVQRVMQMIHDIISSVGNSIKTIVTILVNSIRAVVSSVGNSIKTIVTTLVNSIRAVVSSVTNSIRSIVSDGINFVKSTIDSGLNSVKTTATNALNSLKSLFTDTFNNIKSHVSGVVEWLKGVFNFEWSLPSIKLPHFSVSNWSMNPMDWINNGPPKISVDWYKKAYDKAMVFSRPTVLPTANGFKGFGDGNGAEMVIGQDNLLRTISKASGGAELVSRLDVVTDLLIRYLPEMADSNVYIDKNALVGQIAPAMNRQLGIMYRG